MILKWQQMCSSRISKGTANLILNQRNRIVRFTHLFVLEILLDEMSYYIHLILKMSQLVHCNSFFESCVSHQSLWTFDFTGILQ